LARLKDDQDGEGARASSSFLFINVLKGLRRNNLNICACPLVEFLRCDPRDIAVFRYARCGRALDFDENPALRFIQFIPAQALRLLDR
jgi:hypothetical protein